MPQYFWMAVAQVLGGLVIIILPDKDATLIPVNSNHGPSLLDLAGLILFASGWFWLTVFIIRRWNKIKLSIGANRLYNLIAIYFIGILLIISGLKIESEPLLWIGVFLSSSINLFLIVKAARVELGK